MHNNLFMVRELKKLYEINDKRLLAGVSQELGTNLTCDKVSELINQQLEILQFLSVEIKNTSNSISALRVLKNKLRREEIKEKFSLQDEDEDQWDEDESNSRSDLKVLKNKLKREKIKERFSLQDEDGWDEDEMIGELSNKPKFKLYRKPTLGGVNKPHIRSRID